MTQRIVLTICGMAILAMALTALAWERAKPTPGELQARSVSAAARAAADTARAGADVAEAAARSAAAPDRELALTLFVWSLAMAGAVAVLGVASAGVRAAHLRAGAWVVDLAHPQALVTGDGVTVLGRPAALPAPAVLELPAPAPAVLELAAPGCPSWAALRWQAAPDRVLLGWADGGPVVGRLDDLLSVGVVGRSGSGKSTLLRMIAVQALTLGADVRVLDPHGDIADDLPGLPVADTLGAIETAAGALLVELDRRIALRARHDRPVLIVADEFPAWAGSAPQAQTLLRRVILEGRKFGLFAYISGQGLPAALFASGTMARDALSSRYVFAASAQIARQIGLDADMARQAAGLGVGRAILDGRPCGTAGARVIEVPYCDVTDVRQAAGRRGITSTELPRNFLEGAEGEREGAYSVPGRAEVGNVEAALRAVRAGASITAALREQGIVGGRRYQALAAELRGRLTSGV